MIGTPHRSVLSPTAQAKDAERAMLGGMIRTTTTAMKKIATATRTAELKELLTARRREMQGDIQDRLREGRTERPASSGDSLEQADAHSRGDFEFTLMEMRNETLARIDQALIRLDAGTYGVCAKCAGPIAKRRLLALPFAVRCQVCEEARERAQGPARHVAERRESLALLG